MNPHVADNSIPMLDGRRIALSHAASVEAILGPGVRKVVSAGSQFANRDHWPLRQFVVAFCAWASTHPGQKPGLSSIRDMCVKANTKKVFDPSIRIASTPEKLARPVFLALIGGAYHEAFHTLYSCRREILPGEIHIIVNKYWHMIPDWSKLSGFLNSLSNVIEDIRIERVGIKAFPGAENKMPELQDFILDQEAASRETALEKGMHPQQLAGSLSIATLVLRDLGLGYDTLKQREALKYYREVNPDAVAMVESGPLAPILKEAIELSAQDDVGCFRLAFEMATVLYEEAQKKPDEGGDGKSQIRCCPNCGSKKVKVNKMGSGKGRLVCEECGYEEDVEVQESKGSGSGEGEESPDSKEDKDPDGEESGDYEDKSPKGKGKKGKDSKDSGSSKGDKDKKPKGDKDSGSSKGGKDKKDEDSSEGDEDKKSDDSGGKEGDEDKSSNGDNEGEDGDEDGSGDNEEGTEEDGEGEEADPQSGGHGAGGSPQPEDKPAKGWELTAQEILNALEAGQVPDLLDNNEALSNAIKGQKEREDENLEPGEMPYRPYSRDGDKAGFMGPSARGLAADKATANLMLEEVQYITSYLRARLRQIILSVEQTSVEHGVRKGKGLSPKMFIRDRMDMMHGRFPTRAFFDEEEEISTSLATVTVLDESGSMDDWLKVASSVLFALTEPIDFLGYPTMAIGFRNGYGNAVVEENSCRYFRTSGSQIDIFKAFNESFRAVSHRFAATRATGTTPMADGLQFALEALQERPETHRVIFMVTDGMPDSNHRPVIRWQLRMAKKMGIHVIGVGIGDAAKPVMGLFPESVWASNPKDLPVELLKKLNELLDFRATRTTMARLPTAP